MPSLRVLIVDDQPLMREALCALLANLRPGAEQSTCGSVAEALRLLDTAPLSDIAVLDLCLSDGDSAPVVRRLRAGGGPGPRIFVLSASTDAADARRMLQAGANGHCPKSASAQTLAAALRLVLDGHLYLPPLLLAPPAPGLLGHYTLSAGVVDVGDIAPELAKSLPRHPQRPVTLIGRLAVDVSLHGQGRGTLLLIDALHRSWRRATGMAARAVVVDAQDEAAAAFYQHFDLTVLQCDPRRWYLSMTKVAALLR